jgi:hypothetical protein
LWSDGTVTLQRVVNRPPVFQKLDRSEDRKMIVTDRRLRELTFDP